MKILIIEDEALLAEGLRTLLELRGFEVETVSDGENGAEYAESGSYDLLTYGNTSLDLTGYTLSAEGTVRLSAREFDVMRLLLQMQGRSIKKETILTRVWGYDTNAGENNVEVYVGFLRKKLRAIGSNLSIESIRLLGYHLELHGT